MHMYFLASSLSTVRQATLSPSDHRPMTRAVSVVPTPMISSNGTALLPHNRLGTETFRASRSTRNGCLHRSANILWRLVNFLILENGLSSSGYYFAPFALPSRHPQLLSRFSRRCSPSHSGSAVDSQGRAKRRAHRWSHVVAMVLASRWAIWWPASQACCWVKSGMGRR